MTTSRLIVKNLPNSATDTKVRELFSSRGSVTDVQLKYTPDGRFRHFCFVGYKTNEEAENARQYFNNTYFGASKIQVEACANLGDENKPRAWSKYASEKTEKPKKNKKTNNDVTEQNDDNDDGDEPKPKKKKKEEEILEKCKEDPAFVEFLESHLKKSTWGNDTNVVQDLESKLLGKDKKKNKTGKDRSKPLDLEEKEEQQENNDDDDDSSVKTSKSKNKNKKKAEHQQQQGDDGLDKNEKQQEENEEDNKSFTNKKQKEERKKVLPEKEFFTIKLRNLPEKARKKDLKAFFAPLSLKSIRLPPKFRGIAYIGFATDKDMQSALYKNKSFLHGNQISVRKYENNNKNVQIQAESKKNRWEEQQAALERETETVGESGRIFIRNLSYGTNEEEIKKMFEAYGPVTEVHLPIDRITRQLKGFGFVSFFLPEHATMAFNELDGTVFHGRMLHLLPAKSKDETVSEDVKNAGSSYKKTKELQLKKTAGQTHNWNTLFLGQNAVAEVAAERYNVTKEELLLDNNDETDKNIASVAVRMALAETEIVAETKKFLENNDVFLGAFEGSYVKAPRSTTSMLVKNLPPKTTAQELNDLFSKHGVIARIILPPSGITGIVEFIEPAEARACFKKIAYSKFKNMPLYLEWAPVNIFGQQQGKQEKSANNEESNSNNNTDKIQNNNNTSSSNGLAQKETPLPIVPKEETKKFVDFDYDMIPEPDTTLFVKNLNFSTTEPTMKSHFEESGPIYSVTIAKKRDPKNPGNVLSQGYGFVQFYRAQDASNALKNQQNGMLQNHGLELKRSNRTLQSEGAQRKGADSKANEKGGTKILVRNVPFLASKEEILQLFKTFGELKAVRVPMKLDGSGEHRGFCFIEFHTKEQAQAALQALSKSTHLYGRRLVLEWAAQDDTVDDLRVKTAKKFELQVKGALESSRPKTKQMMKHFEEAQQKKKQQSDSEDDE